jgi:putative ABC transport system permease protein
VSEREPPRQSRDRSVVPPTVEREVDEEFDHHVEMRVRDLRAEGWTEDDARREAVRRFGDMDRLKADCRDLGTRRDVEMDRRLWWDEVRQDLRYAVRQLRRAPSFAAITILTLGVAIGANSAVFSVVNAVLLQPLPYPESDRLTTLWTRYLPPSGFDIPQFAISGPEILDYQETTRTLESLGIYYVSSRTVTGDGEAAERVRVGEISATVFPTLEVQAELGRWFTPEEDVPDGPAVAMLSHALWVDRFGADPTVLGRSILMNGVSTEVVGVMPEGFAYPGEAQAWVPLGLARENQGGRGGHGLYAVGRLAEGMTDADVDAELEVVRERWAQEYEHNVAHYIFARDLHEEVVGDAPRRLRLLMAAVGLVLLIACANIANLLLARAERRQSEVAVRRTLGAGRGRITRQLATESIVLAGLSALAGLGLAQLGLRALVAIDPEALPRLDEVRLDGQVLLFTLAVTVLTALLFGVLPAYLSGRRASPTLASSSGRAVGGRRRSTLRRMLVSGEVAMSLVVVVLAALVVRSFAALASTDPRMDPANLVTFSVSLPETSYPDTEIVPAEMERMLDGLRALPGVESATATTSLPFRGMSQWDFQLNDRPARQEGEMAWNAGISHVADGYFETLGIPILDGRTIEAQDRRDGQLVAVVSEAMAERYWPGERVIGKQFGYAFDEIETPWITIVGLVPDPVTSSLDAEPYPHVYIPQSQAGVSTYDVPRSMQIAVRGSTSAESVLPGIRQAMSDFDSDLALYQLSTMEDIVSASVAGPRVTTNLLGVFAVIALMLAAVGVYGVISYSVAGRTREIGVRVALGAERSEITRLILGEGARPVVVGVVVGLAGAWFSTRLVESMLYDVEPTDPVTFSTIPLVLLTVGVVASLIPALRATRIAPTEALREE